MNIFISGGCKNGKSYHAQRLAKAMAGQFSVPLYYLATMIPTDEEDRARIRRHIAEREGWGFETIEQGRHICRCLERVDTGGVFLLDSVTALLANEMFPPDGAMDLDAAPRLAEDLTEFARRTGRTVFVSDYIYSDARDFDETTVRYRQGLALLDRTLARVCDRVIEVTYGMTYEYKTGRRIAGSDAGARTCAAAASDGTAARTTVGAAASATTNAAPDVAAERRNSLR